MRPPDVEWMLVALATMKPQHRIFAKDYCYQVVKQKEQKVDMMIDNSDGFFTGLPKLTRAKDLRAPAASLLSKKEKEQLKEKRELAKIEKAQAKLR